VYTEPVCNNYFDVFAETAKPVVMAKPACVQDLDNADKCIVPPGPECDDKDAREKDFMMSFNCSTAEGDLFLACVNYIYDKGAGVRGYKNELCQAYYDKHPSSSGLVLMTEAEQPANFSYATAAVSASVTFVAAMALSKLFRNKSVSDNFMRV